MGAAGFDAFRVTTPISGIGSPQTADILYGWRLREHQSGGGARHGRMRMSPAAARPGS